MMAIHDSAATALVETPDGGFAIAGYPSSGYASHHYYWVIRTDAVGTPVWYGLRGGGQNDTPSGIANRPGGGVIVTGYSASYGGAWTLAYDQDGSLDWEKVFTHPGYIAAQSIVPSGAGTYGITAYNVPDPARATLFEATDAGLPTWGRRFAAQASSVSYLADLVADARRRSRWPWEETRPRYPSARVCSPSRWAPEAGSWAAWTKRSRSRSASRTRADRAPTASRLRPVRRVFAHDRDGSDIHFDTDRRAHADRLPGHAAGRPRCCRSFRGPVRQRGRRAGRRVRDGSRLDEPGLDRDDPLRPHVPRLRHERPRHDRSGPRRPLRVDRHPPHGRLRRDHGRLLPVPLPEHRRVPRSTGTPTSTRRSRPRTRTISTRSAGPFMPAFRSPTSRPRAASTRSSRTSFTTGSPAAAGSATTARRTRSRARRWPCSC